MKTNYNYNFRIYGFMTSALGLSGGKLLIYAVIYSFYEYGRGGFYGSQEYLVELTGYSKRTVVSAIGELEKMDLIVRSKQGKKNIYIINTMALEKIDKDELHFDRAKTLTQDGKNLHSESAISAPNNTIENTNNTTTTPSANAPASAENGKSDFVKNVVLRFGKLRSVCLTVWQHQDLRRMVNEDMFNMYVMRLENYLLTLSRGKYVFSHYRTLKKWIFEDLGIGSGE